MKKLFVTVSGGCAYVMEDTVPHGFAVEVIDCDNIEAPEASRGSACCERLDARRPYSHTQASKGSLLA